MSFPLLQSGNVCFARTDKPGKLLMVTVDKPNMFSMAIFSLVLLPSGSAFTCYLCPTDFTVLHQELFWASQLMPHELYRLSFWGRTHHPLTSANAPSSSTTDEVLICFDLSIPTPFFLTLQKCLISEPEQLGMCSWELSFTLEYMHVALLGISGRFEYIFNIKGLYFKKKRLMILAAQLWGTWKEPDFEATLSSENQANKLHTQNICFFL